MEGRLDTVWERPAFAERGGFGLSVSRSREGTPRWQVDADLRTVNQRVILTFAIGGPDELLRVLEFLDGTQGREFDERVQVTFGSFHGRPLRLVKNSPDRGEGHFIDCNVGGVAGGDDSLHVFLNDDLRHLLHATLREVVDTLVEERR